MPYMSTLGYSEAAINTIKASLMTCICYRLFGKKQVIKTVIGTVTIHTYKGKQYMSRFKRTK